MPNFNELLYKTFENAMQSKTKVLGRGDTWYSVETPGQENSTKPTINAGTFENTSGKFNDANCYGYCPTCRSPGVMRERRMNGNDTCRNGHTYPAKNALKYGDD